MDQWLQAVFWTPHFPQFGWRPYLLQDKMSLLQLNRSSAYLFCHLKCPYQMPVAKLFVLPVWMAIVAARLFAFWLSTCCFGCCLFRWLKRFVMFLRCEPSRSKPVSYYWGWVSFMDKLLTFTYISSHAFSHIVGIGGRVNKPRLALIGSSMCLLCWHDHRLANGVARRQSACGSADVLLKYRRLCWRLSDVCILGFSVSHLPFDKCSME